MILEHLSASGRKFGAVALLLEIPSICIGVAASSYHQPYQPWQSHLALVIWRGCIYCTLLSMLLGAFGGFKDELKGLAIFTIFFPIGVAFLLSVGY
jgi:hypothetical protein